MSFDNGRTALGLKKIIDLKIAAEAQLVDFQALAEILEQLQDQAARQEPDEALIAELEKRLARQRATVEGSRQLFISVLSA